MRTSTSIHHANHCFFFISAQAHLPKGKLQLQRDLFQSIDHTRSHTDQRQWCTANRTL